MGSARVLYLIQGREVSGAELMHAELMRTDDEPLIACPPDSPAAALAERLDVAVEPLGFRPLRHSGGRRETLASIGRGIASARELRRILRRHPDRDVVFCTSVRPALLAALAGIGLRRRLIWCVPDLLPPGALGAVARIAARRTAARALCLSHATALDFSQGSPRLRRISRVVHPGVDPSRFDPATTAPGAPDAAILGHVSPTKRTDLAVAIAERVVSEHPDFHLRVIGRAQFRDEDFDLERRLHREVAADRDLRRAVRFSGHQPDVAAALAGCGLLLHCRPDEPFGIALIEAMALGLPVVAPRSGGPLEIVEDGVTGILYRPGDARAAAEAVLLLLSDQGLAARMGSAGRARVERHFSLARQLADTRRLIEEAIPEPAGRPRG